jgi:hypothetical protein
MSMEAKAILMPNCRSLGLDFVSDFIFVSSKLKNLVCEIITKVKEPK